MTNGNEPVSEEDTMMDALADSLDDAADQIDESSLHDGSDLQEFAAKTVYSSFYYFSYGVCFVGFLAGKVIPKTGVVGQGLRDGAAAAQEAVDRITAEHQQIEDEFGAPIELEVEEEPARTAPKRAKPAARKTAEKATPAPRKRRSKSAEA